MRAFVEPRLVCTGLGDRLAVLLVAAALAHERGATVEMQWCTDGTIAIADIRRWIPGFEGWSYDLPALHATLELPSSVRLVEQGGLTPGLPQVTSSGHELDGGYGVGQVYTLAHRTTQLGAHPTPAAAFLRAYHVVGAQLRAKRQPLAGPYVVVHARGRNADTYAPDFPDDEPSCTLAVAEQLARRGVRVVGVSGNLTWARLSVPSPHVEWLPPTSAVEDFALMLGAAGIVQHVSSGYSSFSTVPAMARGIPLLNTFSGEGHRFRHFLRFGDLPPEFHTCRQRKAFVRLAVRRRPVERL